MTRTLDARTLVEAFTLPGSDAELSYREALEGHQELHTTAEALDEFAQILTEGLGWDTAFAEAATALVARVAGLDYPAA
jgi:hypothetical protein